MDNQKMKKSEIDIEIKDLLWELVRKWRIIVVMAIICAVGLATYQYRIDRNKTDVVVVKKTQEELEKAMSVQDISEVTGAVNLLNQLGEKSAYMDASVLMQINPYEEKVVLLQYVIEAEQVEEVLAKAYRAYIEDGYMAQLLAGFRGVEALYVQELISVVDDNTDMYVYSDTMDESIQMELANKEADACFTVKICGLDEASITEMAQNIKTSLNVYSGDLKQKVGEHELKLIEETACVLVDNALAELQNRNATAIKTISNNIDKMKNEMTGDQITLYTYRVTGVTQSENSTAAAPQAKVVTISVKHAVIGAIVGAVLGCAMILVLYVFSAKLRNSDEIKNLYQVKVLGEVENPQKKKRIFSFIDEFIAKVQSGAPKGLFYYERQIQMICTNIAIACKKNEQQKVYLAGSMLQEIPEEILEDIVKQCAKKGIEIVEGFDIVYNANALETLEMIGTVVFLEKKRTSFYDEIYKEILLCRENGIQVMGIVVVGE
ncbi:MAG: hypothetical protein IKW08_01875 [Roseburia sp.]|nr:hypothetical protein [Roseburia sp.]